MKFKCSATSPTWLIVIIDGDSNGVYATNNKRAHCFEGNTGWRITPDLHRVKVYGFNNSKLAYKWKLILKSELKRFKISVRC